MKAKTIRETIETKINEFALSIKNKELSEDVVDDCVVTGGCIASMFLKEEVNDYDMYFTNQTTVFRLAVYYVNEMRKESSAPLSIRLTFSSPEGKESLVNKKIFETPENTTNDEGEDLRGDHWQDKMLVHANSSILLIDKATLSHYLSEVVRVEIFVSSSGLAEEDLDQHPESGDSSEDKPKFRPVFLSSNAITLSDKIQLVIRFVGDAKEIHETYDFVHATNYWTKSEGLVTNNEALEALLSKELIYRGSKYPLASIFRTRKFIKRDWNIHVGNYVKMAMQLNEFDLTNLEVLEEQLTGVDALYLSSLINAIKSKLKDSPTFEFNALYICKLCDRMMGLRQEIEAE